MEHNRPRTAEQEAFEDIVMDRKTQLPIMNFRDVSGYVNRYGETMKSGKIFRGGPLDCLTADHVAYMEEVLGIRYILDYRDAAEAASKPDVMFNKAEQLRIGAMKGDPERERQMAERQRKMEEEMAKNDQDVSQVGQPGGKKMGMDFATLLRDPEKRVMLMANQGHLTNSYRHMLFDNPAYHAMFDRLQRGDGHIYFHCSAGKDRTGLSAMLIMLALGMKEDDIVHEYLLSNEGLRTVNEELCRTCNISPEEAEVLAPMLGVVEKNIRVAMAAIYERYDSAEAFLEGEYGIDESARRKLRAIYCD